MKPSHFTEKRKTLILYFSGTGNTWLAAEKLKARLSERGIASDLKAIEEIRTDVDLGPYSTIGIGYPIYLFSVPGFVYRFLKKLTAGEGRKAFVFATMGGGTFGSEALAALLLRNRGYRVIGAKPFVAPNNDAVLTGSENPDSPEAQADIEGLLRGIDSWVDEIVEGKGSIYKNKVSTKLAAAITGFAFRKLIPLHAFSMPFWFLKADKRCTSCGICERICPVGNIKGSLKIPRFGTRCLLCERCLNFCPKNAIHFLFSPWRPQYRAPGYKPPFLRKPTV